MTHREFNAVVQRMLLHCEETLCSKAAEYATDEERFINFIEALPTLRARWPDAKVEDAALCFMLKHFVSIVDCIRKLPPHGKSSVSSAVWDEKIGDMINYLIIIRGMVHERYGEVDKIIDKFGGEDPAEAASPSSFPSV